VLINVLNLCILKLTTYKSIVMEAVGEYQQELFNYLSDLGIIALQSEMQEIERIVLKRMYSEEEVIDFNLKYLQQLGKQMSNDGKFMNFKEWFNKYKKQ